MNQRSEKIKNLIQTALEPTTLEIIDDSEQHIGHAGAQNGAGHYTINIASPMFNGKNRIECHKLVYTAVNSMIPDEIHALRIKIKT